MAKVTCPACSGAGQVGNLVTGGKLQCPVCGGSGTVSTSGLGDLTFDYIFNPPQLTANQVGVTSLINIGNDYDFLVTEVKANSTGLFSVKITDQFRNTDLSSAAINGENYAGTAQLPRVLFSPWKLLRSSAVVATFNDRSGALNTIQLALGGYKLTG